MTITEKYNAAHAAAVDATITELPTLTSLRAEADALAAKANLVVKDSAKFATVMVSLNATVESYNDLAEREAFAGFKLAENPKLEAAKVRYLDTINARVLTDPATKMVKGVEVEDRKKMIDLLRFCKFAGLPTMWATTVSAYTQWLAVQTAGDIGLSDNYKAELIKKFKVSPEAKEVDMTRFSNSEKVRTLQKIVDEMVFVPTDKEGVNALRVNNHDIAYLTMCLTREGKTACSVKFADDKSVRRIVTNIIHRLAIGGVYSLDYREIKRKAPHAEAVPGTEKTTKKAEPVKKPAKKVSKKVSEEVIEKK